MEAGMHSPWVSRFLQEEVVVEELPEPVRALIAHSVASIAEHDSYQSIGELHRSAGHRGPSIFSRSAGWEQSPRSICAHDREPPTLQANPNIGAFVGPFPKRDQSGETDKGLRISNAETVICVACW